MSHVPYVNSAFNPSAYARSGARERHAVPLTEPEETYHLEIGTGVGTRLSARASTGPTVRMPTHFDAIGILSFDVIRRVVLRNLAQIRHCHQQGIAQNPALGGRVLARFVIGDDGNVLTSPVSESSVPLPSVAPCIAGAVRRWQFPSPESSGTVAVTYPFVLEVAP